MFNLNDYTTPIEQAIMQKESLHKKISERRFDKFFKDLYIFFNDKEAVKHFAKAATEYPIQCTITSKKYAYNKQANTFTPTSKEEKTGHIEDLIYHFFKPKDAERKWNKAVENSFNRSLSEVRAVSSWGYADVKYYILGGGFSPKEVFDETLYSFIKDKLRNYSLASEKEEPYISFCDFTDFAETQTFVHHRFEVLTQSTL